MFDNIIGQENAIKLLVSDIEKNSLNNSIIFHGSKYTGKLSTALELTRIINCLNTGNIDCNCSNCRSINEVNFKGLIFLSRRNFYYLLNEYIKCFKKNNNEFYLKKIINTIKIFLLPFQDFLINNSFNDSEKKQISFNIEKLSEIILYENLKLDEIDNLLIIINKLNSFYKSLNIPIQTIRNMLDWTYILLPDIKRVVIIDHVDNLEKPSQNILLKSLEEPSNNLYFILIAENKNNIAKTVISRCRCYYFRKLDKSCIKKIIENNFGKKQNYNTLEDFLLRDNKISKENIFPVILELINLIFSKEAPVSELSLFLNSFNDRNYVKNILFELKGILEREILRRETGFIEKAEMEILIKISYYNLKMINNIISTKYKNIDLFNLNPILILEGIFYPIKAMVYND